jgi:hypothetical protein
MAKWAADGAMDAMLAYIAAGDRLAVCSAQPTSYAEATTTHDGGASKYCLALITLTAGDGNGDFTIADGSSSGRKVTIAEQAAASVLASASATHIAICTVSGSVLRYVTTCTSQALTSGNTVTVPAFTVEIADPN